MGLIIRMGLYLAFGALAGAGIGSFETDSGSYSVNADDLVTVIIGLAGYAGTFIASRFAKARGGKT